MIGAHRLTDEQLARRAGAGDPRAFELLYERHSGALLSFSRHLLGSREEAEDVLQQTFVRAFASLRAGTRPDHLRAWLFTIARNRALTVLSRRREAPGEALHALPDLDGLAECVERRSELRALLADLALLPEEQRAALLLSELEELPQRRVAEVLGTSEARVRALIYRARRALMADRAARAVPCGEIRAQLAVARGGELRRGRLRRHLRQCASCRAFQRGVARQREGLAALFPVTASALVRDRVLESVAGAGGVVAASGAGGGAVGALVKLALVLALGGGAAAGGAAIEHAAPARAQTVTATRPIAPTPTRTPTPAFAPRGRSQPVRSTSARRVTVRMRVRRALARPHTMHRLLRRAAIRRRRTVAVHRRAALRTAIAERRAADRRPRLTPTIQERTAAGTPIRERRAANAPAGDATPIRERRAAIRERRAASGDGNAAVPAETPAPTATASPEPGRERRRERSGA